jgi:NAD(P)H-hydrate epimerase
MTEPLPASDGGFLGKGAAQAALALAADKTVLALGPGLGQTAAARAEIRKIVKEAPVPVVLDADGVNAFAGAAKELKKRKAPLILTPHPGEAARLMGVTTERIQSDRVAWAREIAAATSALCVLKGYRTVVAAPNGQTFINSTGNPGMASGGMGDTLTGIIAGLVAQELELLDSAVLGVFLHGFAADLAVQERESMETLTARAALDSLPRAFRELSEVGLGGDDLEED